MKITYAMNVVCCSATFLKVLNNLNFKNVLMIIIQRNIYASFRDENLRTVLNIAAREGHVKIMKILLEHYADINTKDKLKVTICSN